MDFNTQERGAVRRQVEAAREAMDQQTEAERRASRAAGAELVRKLEAGDGVEGDES